MAEGEKGQAFVHFPLGTPITNSVGEKDTDPAWLYLLGSLAALGGFAYYIYYSSEFSTFYWFCIIVGSFILAKWPEQLRSELENTSDIFVWGGAGYAASIILVTFIYRSMMAYGLAAQMASFYPLAASSLQVFWDQLRSNTVLVQYWWYAVTAGAMLFVAVAENLLFFGAGLGHAVDGAEHIEGERDNHFANALLIGFFAILFGFFHMYAIYGPSDTFYNFLGNPTPIVGLISLGCIWGLMTVYVGLAESIVVHWLYNMTVVGLGLAGISQIAAGMVFIPLGGIVIYGLKKHDSVRLPSNLKRIDG